MKKGYCKDISDLCDQISFDTEMSVFIESFSSMARILGYDIIIYKWFDKELDEPSKERTNYQIEYFNDMTYLQFNLHYVDDSLKRILLYPEEYGEECYGDDPLYSWSSDLRTRSEIKEMALEML